jgi:beta-glucosidase
MLIDCVRFGTYSVDQSINAGLDLEMPGPPRWRTNLLVHHMLSSQKVLPETLDPRVTNLLTFVQKLARKNPEVVYGDGKERSRDVPETRAFCRKLAADGMVLLKNEHNVLPLKASKVKKVAIIGPSAKKRVISGGGSAALKPTYVISPYEGLTQNVPEGIKLSYSFGCYGILTIELIWKLP